MGQTVRWRAARWRIVGEKEGGVLRLVELDGAHKDIKATPLPAPERDGILPDDRPLPGFDVARSDRARWRAMHQAFLTTMAGGREQLTGLDWGAVAVEPYQLVPLMGVSKSLRARLLITDDTDLVRTAEAGIVLRRLAQRVARLWRFQASEIHEYVRSGGVSLHAPDKPEGGDA